MFWKNVYIAFDAVLVNKTRSILTALGIIFGVAAVIAMLAVGKGAQKEILEQLKIVGVNNVIIKAKFEEKESSKTSESEKVQSKFSTGLTIKDLESIKKVVPNITNSSPELSFEITAYSKNKAQSAKLIGVDCNYFSIFNIESQDGTFFNISHQKLKKQVCVLGNDISKKLFPKTNPIGKRVRVNNMNLMVIGVITKMGNVNENLTSMGLNNYNDEIYMPIETLLLRYKDRSLIGKENRGFFWGGGEEKEEKKLNYHQLDKIFLKINSDQSTYYYADILSRILKRKHNDNIDFEVVIPEQLLNQQKKTNDLFNILLGAIAGISLIVGGIGIMNIMLASVMERIKEIGLRLAVGAQKTDIKQQFIAEALIISLTGGILGVILGFGISFLIEKLLKMPTEVSWFSIILSFVVSIITGLIFGYLPAKKAAEKDPVKSLRYE